ncbi:unnamed protein product [Camellia sinensis]
MVKLTCTRIARHWSYWGGFSFITWMLIIFKNGFAVSLKPELFEGMRFDFTKGLNQRFSLSHSVFMGPTEIPSQSSETIKIPTAHYEFGANFIDPKVCN